MATVFTVRLMGSDWEEADRTWRCPALDLPSAHLKEAYGNGRQIDSSWLKPLTGPGRIHWVQTSKPPEQILATIAVEEELKPVTAPTDERTADPSDRPFRWVSIFIPVVVAIIAGLSGYFANSTQSDKKISPPDTEVIQTLKNEQAQLRQVLLNVSTALPSLIQKSNEAANIANTGGCPGGSNGIPYPHAGDVASRASSVAGTLQSLQGQIGNVLH